MQTISSNLQRRPLVLVPQHFGSMVFDRRNSRYVPFDQESTRLLQDLAARPVDEILAGCAIPEVRDAMTDFFENFYHRGYFTVEGRFAGEVLPVAVPSDHLSGPLALHLEVAASCNLTCTHCFAGTLPRKEKPLNLEELDRLFAEMAGLGTFRLGLTGGEPLLRKDIFEVIDLATHYGLCPCITTNGLLITEEIAREFGKRELVWLNVSLEGASPETNDLVRGHRTFDRVMDKLALLGRHARFTLAFTIMKSNVHEIEKCAELAYQVGAHTAVFRPLYPVGVAKDNMDLMPSFDDYNDALNVLSDLQSDSSFDLCNIDPFSPLTREETQSVVYQNYGCGAGNLVCSVSVSGDVNPCSFLGSDFVADNVRNKSLSEIWHNSQVFRAMRELSVSEPSSLTGKDAGFAGGCRARALAFNGSIDAPDPWITAQVERETTAARLQSGAKVSNPLSVLDLNLTRNG
jgi:radical SAM protein with 4Fe4S-binding SPASM domain